MSEAKKRWVFIAALFLTGLMGLAGISETGYAADSDVMVINNISQDKKKMEIRIRSRLAITEGILEYLLVGDQGKTYESVLKVARNLPSELNFALLLIGCEPLRYDKFMSLLKDGNGIKALKAEHKASLVELTIRQNNEPIGFPQLVRKRKKGDSPLLWVFTGGYFLQNNRFAGDLLYNYIGVWPDRSAIINLFSNLGNPYRGDFGYEMNRSNKELKVDQEFEILIRRVSP